jgi:hypothetical protein
MRKSPSGRSAPTTSYEIRRKRRSRIHPEAIEHPRQAQHREEKQRKARFASELARSLFGRNYWDTSREADIVAALSKTPDEVTRGRDEAIRRPKR